jgi:hypothetical protein
MDKLLVTIALLTLPGLAQAAGVRAVYPRASTATTQAFKQAPSSVCAEHPTGGRGERILDRCARPLGRGGEAHAAPTAVRTGMTLERRARGSVED